MPSLLVFSRDPGPTNLLIAILEALSKSPKPGEPAGLAALRAAAAAVVGNIHVLSRPPGDAIWRDAGFRVEPWNGHDVDAALRLLQASDAALVLTGTSDLDETGDRLLWRAARKQGIASHAALDHPAGLVERFQEPDGTMIWPDWFYVTDDTFRARLVAIGAPAERMRLIGDLHHARLRRLAASRKPGEVRMLRAAWGADDTTYVLLFASECVREMSLLGFKTTYDEMEVLDALLGQLAHGERPGGGCIDKAKMLVVVRPHPRDVEGKYEDIIAKAAGAIRAVINAKGAADLAILAADLTVGMNSSLLYEAVQLGRPAISLTGHDIFADKSTAV